MKVLVVDDTEVVARLFTIQLELQGHEVVEITKDFQRLYNVNSSLWEGVDVIVCDNMLPGVEGRKILATAKAYYPDIFRILVTGSYFKYGDLEAPEAQRILYKPNDVEKIVSIVDTLGRSNDG